MPEDLPELRSAHQALFPIDYESHFYECVIYNRDQIFSWAAVSRSAYNVQFASEFKLVSLIACQTTYEGLDACRDPTLQHERLIGFVTARTFRLYDCSIADRACMGLDSRWTDMLC